MAGLPDSEVTPEPSLAGETLTTVAVHQPNFLPYPGFFYKMALADVFILYDTAQFVRREYHNRNRIKGPNGVRWLTVPVKVQGIQSIRDIQTDDRQPWRHRIWETIHACYRRAPYFRDYAPLLEETFRADSSGSLAEFNEALIHRLKKALGLRTELRLASELPPPSSTSPTGKLIELAQAVHGDTYLSGAGAQTYIDRSQFKNVEMKVAGWSAVEYPQLWNAFVPNLSIVDALFNCGPSTAKRLFGLSVIDARGGTRESDSGTERG